MSLTSLTPMSDCRISLVKPKTMREIQDGSNQRITLRINLLHILRESLIRMIIIKFMHMF